MTALIAALGVLTMWVFYWLGYTAGQRDERTRRRARAHYIDTVRMARRGAR